MKRLGIKKEMELGWKKRTESPQFKHTEKDQEINSSSELQNFWNGV